TLPAFASASRTGPVDAGAGSPSNSHNGTARVDYSLSSRTTLMVRYAALDSDEFAAVRQPYTADLDQAALTRNQNATLNLTQVWSPAFISESRIVFNRLARTLPEAGPNGLFFLFPINNEQNVILPTGRPRAGGPRNLYQLQQILNFVRGTHHVRSGGQAIQYRDALSQSRVSNFSGVRPRFANVQGLVDGRLSTVSVEYHLV